MDVYYALAETNRRLILEQLAQHGEMASNEIASIFRVSASAISQHLKVLFDAGLVVKKKQAQKRIYSINTEGFAELDKWRAELEKTWNSRLNNLEKHLQKNS